MTLALLEFDSIIRVYDVISLVLIDYIFINIYLIDQYQYHENCTLTITVRTLLQCFYLYDVIVTSEIEVDLSCYETSFWTYFSMESLIL